MFLQVFRGGGMVPAGGNWRVRVRGHCWGEGEMMGSYTGVDRSFLPPGAEQQGREAHTFMTNTISRG